MHYDYDVAVLGGGAAGLTAAGFAANFGAKTIMIEKAQLGGDCTWTGCVPSKSLLHAAKVAHTARTARTVGIETGDVTVDFPKVMEHVRSLREEVYEDADRPEIFEAMGVEVVQGAARFVHPHRLAITEQETEQGEERVVTFRYAVVCTGGRAAVPPIEGLDAVDYLTNHSLFEISEQPARLAIIGGGPIGVEMSQAFGRLGTEVVVLDRADRILGRDDPDHARMLREALGKEGVQFELGVDVDKVSQEGETKTVTYSREGQAQTVEVDALLIATGRTPNIENLGLVEAGVGFTEKGIRVDEQCRTSAPHIFAAGDVTGEYQLTHMAEHMARTAVSTIVLKVPSSLDRAHVPWVTFAEPELAHLGASEAELRERGEAFEDLPLSLYKSRPRYHRGCHDGRAQGVRDQVARHDPGRERAGRTGG